MISKFAFCLANYFAEKNMYCIDKINIYRYGLELLISTMLNTFVILVISVIMNEIIGALLFCIAFIPMRLIAGGYHAKHHWSCILGFGAIFIGFMIFMHYMNDEYMIAYMLFSSVISSLLLWSYAPIEASNKPLKERQRQVQRKKSMTLACVNLAIVLLLYAIPQLNNLIQFLIFYTSGALAASLSLAVASVELW